LPIAPVDATFPAIEGCAFPASSFSVVSLVHALLMPRLSRPLIDVVPASIWVAGFGERSRVGLVDLFRHFPQP
jgi:hypothetical protein